MFSLDLCVDALIFENLFVHVFCRQEHHLGEHVSWSHGSIAARICMAHRDFCHISRVTATLTALFLQHAGTLTFMLSRASFYLLPCLLHC